MVAQDVADDELAPAGPGRGDDFLSLRNAFGQGLLDEHMTPRLQCRYGIRGMGVGVSRDGNSVRCGFLQGLEIVGKEIVAATKLVVEFLPRTG